MRRNLIYPHLKTITTFAQLHNPISLALFLRHGQDDLQFIAKKSERLCRVFRINFFKKIFLKGRIFDELF